MSVKVNISGSSKETGALLVEFLSKKGLYDKYAKATVCYGASTNLSPALNIECATDKITRLQRMEKYRVLTVPWSIDGVGLEFPLLARTSYGYGGTDIVPVFQPEELTWRKQSGYDWFSSYVPLKTEYRVWVFRGQHLGTYEKVMNRPQEYKFVGRNFRNGFDFQATKEIKLATIAAANAIEAVGLDFAAVDMILGKDNKYYILELNTAPGVIKSGAQKSLHNLVDCIETWVANGYN